MDAFLARPHAEIAYAVDGAESERLLLVTHEPTASRRDADAWGVLRWSAVVAAGERVLRYDTRGHGASTGRAVEDDYRWSALAGDLLALAEATSPEHPVDALAVAGGCGTLLHAAVAAPDRFRRLVLVIPPPVGEARARQAELYRAAAALAELRGAEGWARGAAAMPPVPVLVEGGWRRPAEAAVPESLLPLVVRAEAASVYPEDEALAALGLPTLVLTWRSDPSHPVEGARAVAAVLPSAVLEVADDAEGVRGWGERIAGFLAGS
ncbi:alpha/beta hydrolase [Amnibacterium sp. CER49]|uniref:alpha/beta fold hydrolase n=1 Tax=Amnibacterium sp. CER49 TaxID=3039161 RepID=UPI00244B77B8|nr:alpha/beta fold hydrolase [Amnibacterium sp. CER49]MDH2444138.1 alpha/beta hydrolase [Amnibacterium sp. CER49]